jgi:NADH dehydrogenase
VVVPLRRVLRRCRILNGWVTRIDTGARGVDFEPRAGENRRIPYDVLVVAVGSISRTLPIPGPAECGIGFKTLEEAVHLRDQVLAQLDLAASTDDPQARRKALTLAFVGAGFAGVEALAELEDMATDACRYFPTVERSDMSWFLVEATDRILPEVGPEMGRWTTRAGSGPRPS